MGRQCRYKEEDEEIENKKMRVAEIRESALQLQVLEKFRSCNCLSKRETKLGTELYVY